MSNPEEFEIDSTGNRVVVNSGPSEEFLTITIANQLFGIPVLQVQDVLGQQTVTKIPMSPSEVDGALNLRGRIVTAINVRKRLGLDELEKKETDMSVVVEHENELYSLIIDSVGDVLSLQNKDYEPTPATLDKMWKDVSSGIYRLEQELLVVLNVPELIGTIKAAK